MNVLWAVLIVVAAASVAITAMLLVRRRAPEGSFFADGDRAAGIFGVLATSFALLIGFMVFLAFESYDQSRGGAEDEATLVAQLYETAQLMPPNVRGELSGQLVCYARSVVHEEWPAMEAGTIGQTINPWGARLFRTLQSAEPTSAAEGSAYDHWLEQNSQREAARNDRIHGAVGVIPLTVWIVLLLTAAVTVGYMLLFADRGERAWVQAALMGCVVVVVTATLLLISGLDDPFHEGVGGLGPTAMERTIEILDQGSAIAGVDVPPPCDARGKALEPR